MRSFCLYNWTHHGDLWDSSSFPSWRQHNSHQLLKQCLRVGSCEMGGPVLSETERCQQSSSRNGSRRGEKSCRRRFLARPDSKMAHANPGERHGLRPFILLLSESVSHSVASDSLRPHGLQPTRLLHPWEFPGKSTGVGHPCLLLLLYIST